MDLIKYGISREYLPNWGIDEALREIFQNFEDFGVFDTEENDEDTFSVKMSNNFNPTSLEFLKIGISGKRGDNSKIGQHGEGLKMALLILLREELDVAIDIPGKRLVPVFYDDIHLGECFGIEIHETANRMPFSIEFDIDKDSFREYDAKLAKRNDIIHENEYYGQIIDKNAGDIYVGGLFVTNIPKLTYAYNFPPSRISLDRDRKTPSSWDVEWNASKIVESWKGFKAKAKDLNNRDLAYVDTIPDKMIKGFKARRVNKKIVFVKDGVIAPERLSNCFLKNSRIQKEVTKIKFKMNRKRNPENILKHFYSKYSSRLIGDAGIDFKVILQQSKKWSQHV